MEQLCEKIISLKNTSLSDTIGQRMREFSDVWESGSHAIFGEMCFCILTANFQAKRAMHMQNAIGKGFEDMDEISLASALKKLGHRYPNARASYIVGARRHIPALKGVLSSFSDELSMRDWVASNVKGLGYKESSHFLRNIGFCELAIIDFHIVDLLVDEGLIKRPKSISKKKYLEIEQTLKIIGGRTRLSQAELDLYLWFIQTGQVLK